MRTAKDFVYADWRDRNIDFELARFEYSTTSQASALKYLAIVPKSEATKWLEQFGKPE